MPKPSAPPPALRLSTPVQIISVIFYAGFAISVSIVAMALFGLVGVLLALVFAWQWGRIPALSGRISIDTAAQRLRPDAGAVDLPPSGNTSFDRYRAALLTRLDQEREQFDGFLDRLREAKDKHEFDRFMDDRAQTTAPRSVL